MSVLTITLLRFGFLALLWIFIFAVIASQARDLAVRCRVRQAGPFGQIGDAQFVAGEQQRREQARLSVRPEDRSEERRLGSHITEIILHYIDTQSSDAGEA